MTQMMTALESCKALFESARTLQREGTQLAYKEVKSDKWTQARQWHRSYKGMISGLWHGMKNRVGKNSYKDTELRMTKEEFFLFCDRNSIQLHQMYFNWLCQGFPRDSAPSVDRIDPRGHYELSNIQFLTQHENVLKVWTDYYARFAPGTKWCSKCKEIHPITDFQKNRLKKDGYSCYCRKIDNQTGRINYLKRKNKV